MSDRIYDFGPMTHASFSILRKDLQAKYDVSMVGDVGMVTAWGCVIGWCYANNQLSVQLLGKPLLVPEGLVQHQIRNFCRRYIGVLHGDKQTAQAQRQSQRA